uniref:p20 protein n=1 Tax=Citrus tristeza virus TaxID=12162 RepID=A0A059WME1_9CLOS|nr:p20 protein [Citrus tristeza virus]
MRAYFSVNDYISLLAKVGAVVERLCDPSVTLTEVMDEINDFNSFLALVHSMKSDMNGDHQEGHHEMGEHKSRLLCNIEAKLRVFLDIIRRRFTREKLLCTSAVDVMGFFVMRYMSSSHTSFESVMRTELKLVVKVVLSDLSRAHKLDFSERAFAAYGILLQKGTVSTVCGQFDINLVSPSCV